MNSFDYLNKIGLGIYIPGKTFLHEREPRIKVLALMIILLGITFSSSIIGISIFLGLIMLAYVISKLSIKPAFQTIYASLFFIIFIVILQILFYRPLSSSILLWNWKFIQIFDTALVEGFEVFLRFITLIICISLSSTVISTLEINHGLELLLRPLQKIGVNTNSIVMVIQIMLRFLPILALRMEEISKSQASRGAEWDSRKGGLLKRIRLYLPLLLPLLISSLHQAERTTEAIISRAYGLKEQRSHFYQYEIDKMDVFSLLLIIITTVIVLFIPRSIL